MALNILAMAFGLLLAAAGGELFVRGVVGLAAWARIPAGVIGTTVAAFATSSPELTVAISAAAEGSPEIALGDALGSNIVNIGLVIGLVLFLGVKESSGLSRRDAVTALALALLLLALLVDGEVSQVDGLVLLLAFATWLGLTIRASLRLRSDVTSTLGESSHPRTIVVALLGLACLIVAGRLLVSGAKGIGEELGISTFVIGVVLVSLGTSLPELATAIVARIRGHAEVGLGAALGSNIFNVTFIVGLTAVLAPIAVETRVAVVTLLFGAALIPILFVGLRGPPERWRGAVLLVGYGASLAVLAVVV